MEYYVEQTVKRMEMGNKTILGDISLFNTTIAFDRNNIVKLFDKIYGGSLAIKYSFFKYISVLLFKESDNLLAINEERPFWTSEIWDFKEPFVGIFGFILEYNKGFADVDFASGDYRIHIYV